jgi:hypothetical protein
MGLLPVQYGAGGGSRGIAEWSVSVTARPSPAPYREVRRVRFRTCGLCRVKGARVPHEPIRHPALPYIRPVIDLAHPQNVDDGGLTTPKGLTVTPASGPVGTEVTLEGRGCGNLDEPVRLVFQSHGPAAGRRRRSHRAWHLPVHDQAAGLHRDLHRHQHCPQHPGHTPGTLPFTGPHTPMLLAIASGLLTAGAGLLLLVRRHTRRTA